MISKHNSRIFTASSLVVLMVLLPAATLMAQSKQLYTWLEDLTYLQNASSTRLEEQRVAVAQIYSGIEIWLKLTPESSVSLPPAPLEPWNVEQIREIVNDMNETVQSLIDRDASRAFDLGPMEITVTAETSPLSPVISSLGRTEIRNLNVTDVAQSLPFLPGIGVDHNSASGRMGIMLRGFDSRQVGLYVDGMPTYIPYDGFADISRFLTGDLSEIDVAKGYSSPLLGPNGLGGAVNLVTRQPGKKLDADAAAGTGSGNRLESLLHLGSRWRSFFVQGGMDWLQTDYFPVSGKFVPNEMQQGYDRLNSDRRDVRYNGRFGWTPRENDRYVLSYSNQKSDYGVPPYSGTDTENNKAKFWRWPYWKKEMYYFNSNTGLGAADSVKFRAFYDRYRNNMTGFTDSSYSSVSSVAPYDDYSAGASAEFTTRRFSRHSMGASFLLKDDVHKESGTTYTNTAIFTEPWRTQHDRMFSIGFQDIVTVSSRIRATLGFSEDILDAVKAEDLITTVIGSGKNAVRTYSVEPFSCGGSDCPDRIWNFNPVASISYSLSERSSLFFSFARKSHFPMLKDRYSYRYGRAIPNPALQAEHARNWSLGFSHIFGRNTVLQADLFRSDVSDAIQNAIVPAEYEGQCPSMPDGQCQQAVNVGKEVHKGVEIALQSKPVSRLTLKTEYSYLQWNISGPTNMLRAYPVRAPKHKIVSTANLILPREILLLGAIRYESGTLTINDTGTVTPASKFATADIGFTVPLLSGMNAQTGVENLFDRNYYYREGFPEPGRIWHFSIRYCY
ncbi:MAG: TonB-dependent receptor [Acidobacteria bacterium]|nr:TonB-dependent receptor [Acidobacteriota bacterium]